MEGYLLVPPERSALIGKSGWKTRYITVGTIHQRHGDVLPRPELPRTCSASKLIHARKDLRAASAIASTTDLAIANPEKLWLAVFKQKGDIEPISHNAVNTIKSCEIQSIQFRKSDPAVSTLIITFEVDAAAERIRKRRSSRAGILQAPSSSYPNSLLFRTISEERYNIYDWQVTIQPRIQPNTPDFAEESDSFSGFTNPFGKGERPKISKPILRPEPFHRHSHTKDFGNRPTTSSLISPSPSLRSRRSDLSSQSSFLARPHGHSHLPIQSPSSDLPSPASTLGYEEQFITGITNAQGRSSALSNHTRANSVSAAGSATSTPPIPRETILDRAFNLNYIPGSDQAGNETMSSIQRFEALMQDHERRKKAADASRPSTKEKDAWSLAEEGDSETESSYPPSRATNQSRRGNFFNDAEDTDEALDDIPLKAQRALEYIMSGRNTTPPAPMSLRPKSSRTKSYNQSAMPPPPPTSTLPPIPQPPARRQRPMSFSHSNAGMPTKEAEVEKQPALTVATQNLNRQSGSSQKRLSFSEFARRLSSNSSVLLVQSNTRNSGASGVSSTSTYDEDKENEEAGKGLTANRSSGMNQLGQTRPGMGVRRSTVAAETQRYTMGGYEGGYARHGQERSMPNRGVWDDGKARTQQCRGSGLFTGGEGGFL